VALQQHQGFHLFSEIVLIFFDFVVTESTYDNQTWAKMFRKNDCKFCNAVYFCWLLKKGLVLILGRRGTVPVALVVLLLQSSLV